MHFISSIFLIVKFINLFHYFTSLVVKFYKYKYLHVYFNLFLLLTKNSHLTVLGLNLSFLNYDLIYLLNKLFINFFIIHNLFKKLSYFMHLKINKCFHISLKIRILIVLIFIIFQFQIYQTNSYLFIVNLFLIIIN